MGSPFKMKPQSPMMKALVGKQGNLPQHLKDKILAAPETAKKGSPAKSYGSKTKSPVMKKPNPYGDVVLDTKKETIARGEKGSYTKKRGGENIITTETVQKGMSAARRAKIEKGLKSDTKQGRDDAGLEMTKAQRKGYGRIGTKTYVRQKDTGAKGSKGYMAKSTIAGTKGMRTLADGSKVVVEGSASNIKKKGLASPKPKAAKLTRRAVGLKEKTVSAIKPKKATAGKPSTKGTEELKKKKTSPVKKKGVKALEAQRGTKNASPIKKYGSKKSPVMQQKLKKKDTKGKDGSFGEPGTGMQRSAGQRKFKVGGVTIKANVGKTRGATDLYEEGKKLVKSLSGKGKGSGARARKRKRS